MKNISIIGPCVYLIRSSTGLYKIGRTKSLRKRMQAYATLPDAIEFVHAIGCDDEQEAETSLHKKFVKYRVRGEWFSLKDSDIEWLKSLTYFPRGFAFVGDTVTSQDFRITTSVKLPVAVCEGKQIEVCHIRDEEMAGASMIKCSDSGCTSPVGFLLKDGSFAFQTRHHGAKQYWRISLSDAKGINRKTKR